MLVVKTSILIALLLLIQPAKQKTILFFGDSLTAGYGLSAEEAFPALLEKELNKDKQQVKVINGGLSGETSAGGLSRIDWLLRKPIDVFVLELGANDGLRGLQLTQTKKNLQAIIDKVKTKYPDVKIIVAGMMVPPNMGKQYTEEFKNMFPQLAAQNKTVLIPFILKDVGGIEKLNQADGIHPTAEGHKIIAKNIKPILEKLL
jgi:acyl-CoA thioesterase-1